MINKYVYNNIQNSQYFLFINDNGDKKFFYDDEFVRFIDDVYEHKKLIVKTMKRLKPYTSDDVSSKVIKKTKLLIRELNEYTHNYYGNIFVGNFE